jgi:hypothetical protein
MVSMKKISLHKSLIRDYLTERDSSCWMDSVVKYTCEQKTFKKAIMIAVMSKDVNGNKHSHQWHIYNNVYVKFIQNLLRVKDKVKKAKNFDGLYDIIYSNKPSGVGELFCYDTALRIGQRLGKLPEKIYIHAGTRIGLRNLLNRTIYEKTILQEELPEPFCSCHLTPAQLENFFCLYKDIFPQLNKKPISRKNATGKKCRC